MVYIVMKDVPGKTLLQILDETQTKLPAKAWNTYMITLPRQSGCSFSSKFPMMPLQDHTEVESLGTHFSRIMKRALSTRQLLNCNIT